MALFLLLLICHLHAATLFHSNFENERTYTANALQPGAKKIELLPSPEIEQWFPETGGEAIIEPNYPKNREVFQYTKRQGRTLFLDHVVGKPHPRHAAIRTGGLAEWFSDERKVSVLTSGMVNPDRSSPLHGSYSVMVQCSSNAQAVLACRFSESGHRRLHVRFLIRFSSDFFEQSQRSFPLSRLYFGNKASLQLILAGRKGGGSTKFVLADNSYCSIVKQENREVVGIRPETVHCVETSTEFLSEGRSLSRFWVDGQLQAVYHSQCRPVKHDHGAITIGKWLNASFPGKIWLDEIIVADTMVGVPEGRPSIAFVDRALVSLPIEEVANLPARVSTQWQVSGSNAWLLPSFNSGMDTVNLLELPHPHYRIMPQNLFKGMHFNHPVQAPAELSPGQAALGRVRHLNANGVWSSWSRPVLFSVPPFPPVLKKERPRLTDTWFSLPEKRTRISQIEPAKWYDLHLRFSPAPKRTFVHVFLTGNPETCLANYRNTGGPFRVRDNYMLSFGFQQSGLYTKQDEGSDYINPILGEKGTFVDDGKGVSLYDHENGQARTRVRLSDSARVGTWKLAAFMASDKDGVSPFHQSLFTVGPGEPTILQVIVGRGKIPALLVILVLLPAIGFWIGRKRGHVVQPQEHEKSNPVPKQRPYDERIKSADDFIRANYSRPISLQDVADAVFVSANWLSKLYKKQTGKNMFVYINELRIQKAQELLRDTNLKISEIALQVGFNSVGVFNETFKKYTMSSPLAYRETARDRISRG